MNLFNTSLGKHRFTETEKKANDLQYYKDKVQLLDHNSVMGGSFNFGGVSDFKRKKVNYDLFNNIIDELDFSYVCTPYGAEVGELPANMTNRDIVSGKIKVLLGMESRMPFDWRPVAVNREATTRKEQEYSSRLREYVGAEIMRPIRVQVEQQSMAQLKGRDLTPQEKQQLQQQIEDQTKAQTPDEVRKYMLREHQDPSEVLAEQILEYLIQDQKIPEKLNKMFKHGLLGGDEVGFVGILNKKVVFKVINTMYFDYDASPDLDDIADGEWATMEYRMTPSEVLSNFSDLTDDEIDRIYNYQNNPSYINDADFTFDTSRNNEAGTIRVFHANWKGLRKIQFLSYYGKTGDIEVKVVSEHYKINKKVGDINIEEAWIPVSEECYKIMDNIYVNAGPVLGQNFDMDNLFDCKLSYFGGSCDNLNSPVTAAMDRIKAYQYYFDIVLYRVELLMASDKGKILLANINSIPKSMGIDTAKFMYFLEANHIGWFNPQEEGKRGLAGGDVNTAFKEIDMSLVSNIKSYIDIAEYIERKCGDAIGVTKQMEGQIGPTEAVTNTKQNLVQSSYIIQPYFDFHNGVKKNGLQMLIDTAKVCYTLYPPNSLNYVLDDMSVKMLTIDSNLLAGSTVGIYVANSTKAEEAKQAVQALAQAALQNQQAELADIIKVIRADSINEAEELVEVAQQKRKDLDQANQRQQEQDKQNGLSAVQEHEKLQWTHDEEMIVLKAKEDRTTKVQVATIGAMGFDANKDEDEDGIPDTLEVAKFGADADIKKRALDLKEREFAHQQEQDSVSNSLEKQKIKMQKSKASLR